MLSEPLVISTFDPSKSVASKPSSKDASICIYHQSTTTPQSTFKKSSTKPRCLAVSKSHIFAAQAEKAAIHVYSRERGNLEALVPFTERISCITFSGSDSGGGVGVLIIGTEGGRLILWEVATGRQIITSEVHLDPITTLAVSSTRTHLLSGSEDSDIHVWSLTKLLSFSQERSDSLTRSSLSSFNRHRSGITSLIVGHSFTSSNIAISASTDSLCMIWDYHTGQLLRTIILPSMAVALALDPADRAFYAGYSDGTVQTVSLGHESFSESLYTGSSAPFEPPKDSRWRLPFENAGALHALAVSYDGTTLLSSHASGHVLQWNVGCGKDVPSIVLSLEHPITNLITLLPTEIQPSESLLTKLHAVTKPRFDATFDAATTNGVIPNTYNLHAQLLNDLSKGATILNQQQFSEPSFATCLAHPSFPASMLHFAPIAKAGRDENTNGSENRMQMEMELETLDGTTEKVARVPIASIESLTAELAESRAQQKRNWDKYCGLLLEKSRWQEQYTMRHKRGLREDSSCSDTQLS